MNYKESTVSGTLWTRCHSVVITNPIPGIGIPAVAFTEQKVVSVDGVASVIASLGSIRKEFTENSVIPLRDPISGYLTGATMTHADLYNALYSLYMQTALERDQANG